MKNIIAVKQITDWSIYTTVVDFLTDKNKPIPADLTKMNRKLYYDALNDKNQSEKGLAEYINNFRREAA